MGYIYSANRHEVLWFPVRLDDYIAEANPVRFIDVFSDDGSLFASLRWLLHTG
jgi:hypothetical protein